MHTLPLIDAGTLQRMADGGLAVADEETMSQAIHAIYCGPDADHDTPNEKDRQQARSMIASLQQALAALYPV